MKKLFALMLGICAISVLPIGCTPVEKETTIIEDSTPDVKKETTIIEDKPDVIIQNPPPK